VLFKALGFSLTVISMDAI